MRPGLRRTTSRTRSGSLTSLGLTAAALLVAVACGDDRMGPRFEQEQARPADATPRTVDGTPNKQNWKQCQNDHDYESECDWVTGNLNQSHNTYAEGDFVPKVLVIPGIEDPDVGGFEVVMTYGFLKGGLTTHDFLGRWDLTMTNANPCTDGSFDQFCDVPGGTLQGVFVPSNSMAALSQGAVEAACGTDSQHADDMENAIIAAGAGNLVIEGLNVESITVNAITFSGCPVSGDAEATLNMTVVPSAEGVDDEEIMLLFGAHVARATDWTNGGAGGVSGSPYHLGLISVDGASAGSMDLQMAANAIVPVSSITIIKDAVPDAAQDFAFTTTGFGGDPSFTLDDDADGTLSNTEVFSMLAAGIYTIDETLPVPGWALTDIVCEGATSSTITIGADGDFDDTDTGVSIDLAEGEDITCTFTNTLQQGSLQIRKRVINDDGGTAVVGDFNVNTDAGALSFDGGADEGGGTTLYTADAIPVNTGQYTLREDDVAGYAEGTWTCTGATPDNNTIDNGAVTVPAGVDVVCTIENDDDPGSLQIRKRVINNDGGTAVVGDFNVNTDAGALSFDGGADEGGGTTLYTADAIEVAAGAYTLREDDIAGYMEGTWACTGGNLTDNTISAGSVTVANDETVVCTIENDDSPGSLQIRKRVINDHGGTADVTNFNVTTDAGGLNFDAGVDEGGGSTLYTADALMVGAGTYTLREDDIANYTEGTWTCTGATPDNNTIDNGAVTVPLGVDVVCTIENDDDPASLQVRKRVINDDGGTADVSNFNVQTDAGGLNFDAGADEGGGSTLYTADALEVAAGSYTLQEDNIAGYTEGTWSCTGATASPNTFDGGIVDVPLAGSVVCTIDNDDEPASISGFKYFDSGNDGDADGSPDAGDSPLSGWEISLFESDGVGGWNLVTTTTTAGDGSYSFENLAPGDYLVCEELKANFIESYPVNTDCMTLGVTYEPGGYEITLGTGQDSENNNFFNAGEVFGCTPGYWKNHTDRWTGHASGDLVSTVFTSAPADLNGDGVDDTLHDALNYRGGNGAAGGARILLRAAVASLLNFSSGEFIFVVPDLPAITSEADLIDAVNTALGQGRAQMLALAGSLDDANNAVNSCPLSGTRAFKEV